MNTGIIVIAYNRPNYLYVTLDSIFRAPGIEKYPVYVYFDGPLSRKLRIEQERVLSQFPIAKSVFREENYNILLNITCSIKETFDDGVDEVAYFEDDHLLIPRFTQYIETAPRGKAFFITFNGKREKVSCHYRQTGNMIEKSNFSILYDYVMQKKYIGKQCPGRSYIFDEKTCSHDAVYNTFMLETGFVSYFPAKINHVGHFGIYGTNALRGTKGDRLARTTIADVIEQKMFKGENSEWLENVVQVFRRYRNEPSLHGTFCPKKFDYYNY